MDSMNEFLSFNDQPLINDQEMHFQFMAYANSMTKLISSKKTQTPLSIGINGEWGSGKTTLMRSIQRRLDELAHDQKGARKASYIADLLRRDCFRRCRTVWFNAWKYSESEHLFTALLQEIIKEMKRDGFFYRMYAELNDPEQPEVKVPEALISALTQVFTLGKVDIDFSKFETESRFKTNLAFYDEFQAFFDRLVAWYVSGRRGVQSGQISDEDGALVIFIDDLDRCLPEKSIQVLETIKLFMDKPGIIFVIGADLDIITASVEAHYRGSGITGIKSADYIDKIIQIRFDLPPINKEEMQNFVLNLPDVDERLKNSLEIIARGLTTNPRKIKTFINHIELQWDIIVNAGMNVIIEKKNLIEWLVLKAACPEFVDLITAAEDNQERVSLLSEMRHYSQAEYRISPIKIDLHKGNVYIGGLPVNLTVNEFKFIKLLYERKNQVVHREEVIERIWETNQGVSDQVLDTLLYRLRKKFGSEHEVFFLETVRGHGYRLNINEFSEDLPNLRPELVNFQGNIILKRILTRGDYEFTPENIGNYIHLSPMQSLHSEEKRKALGE